MQPVTPRSVAELQLILIITSAVPTFFVVDPLAAKAVAFGGAAALANVLLLEWRMRRGGRYPWADAHWHFRQAFLSFLERMAVVAALFMVSVKLLGFALPAVLAGFVLGQMAWFAAPLWVKLKSKNGF